VETVTAIIPSWNRKEDLALCLRGLQRQDYPALEIVVVDNGSTDGTAEMLRALPEIKVIWNDYNLGACRARNEAVLATQGTFLWFLDSDVEILDPGLLRRLVDTFQKAPSPGCLGGEALIEESRPVGFLCCHITSNGGTSREWIRKMDDHLVACDYLPTANCLIPRALFESLGGFNPVYGYLAEDKELGFRIKKAGYYNWTAYPLTVWHKESPVSRIGRFRLYHQNRLRFVLLNFRVREIILLPFFDLLFWCNPQNWKKVSEGAKHGYVRKDDEEKGSSQGKGLQLVWTMAYSFFYAYIWNLMHLRETWRIRKAPRIFLKRNQK
jgi:GT2 family glycosyltransferase